MIPKPPPREPSLGFLYVPPYRVQGISVAGEATCVMVPELDVCFDMGLCPRASLSAKYLALSHGHMDHIGGLAYWCSQRNFQGMGAGNIVCHPKLVPHLRTMLEAYEGLEQQKMPYELIPLEAESMIEIKNNMFLKAFDLDHGVPCNGYSIIERRTKLKPEYGEHSQDELTELKNKGVEITNTLHIPLVAYLSDTAPGPPLLREDVLNAKVVIAECTFSEPGHQERASVGHHMHVDHIVEWAPLLQSDALVLIHLSRRSNIPQARKSLQEKLPREVTNKIHFLMDYRSNKFRYDKQAEQAEREQRERERSTRNGG